jgi:hypothetical protein
VGILGGGGELMYRSTFSLLWNYLEVSSQLNTLAALPLVPTGQENGWAPEPVWMTWRKFLSLLGLELRPFGHSTHSQSLYRLSSLLLCVSTKEPWYLACKVLKYYLRDLDISENKDFEYFAVFIV